MNIHFLFLEARISSRTMQAVYIEYGLKISSFKEIRLWGWMNSTFVPPSLNFFFFCGFPNVSTNHAIMFP